MRPNTAVTLAAAAPSPPPPPRPGTRPPRGRPPPPLRRGMDAVPPPRSPDAPGRGSAARRTTTPGMPVAGEARPRQRGGARRLPGVVVFPSRPRRPEEGAATVGLSRRKGSSSQRAPRRAARVRSAAASQRRAGREGRREAGRERRSRASGPRGDSAAPRRAGSRYGGRGGSPVASAPAKRG